MAPDYIYDLALLEVSRWQREGIRMIDISALCRKAVTTNKSEDYQEAAYACGFYDPNYNLPVAVKDADIASNHRWLTEPCPYKNLTPCWSCLAEFEDGIVFHFLYSD